MDGEARLPVDQVIVAGGTYHDANRHITTHYVRSSHRAGNAKTSYGIFIGIITGIVANLITFTTEVEGLVFIVFSELQHSDICLVSLSQTTVG